MKFVLSTNLVIDRGKCRRRSVVVAARVFFRLPFLVWRFSLLFWDWIELFLSLSKEGRNIKAGIELFLLESME
jgi:hypothetical protein